MNLNFLHFSSNCLSMWILSPDSVWLWKTEELERHCGKSATQVGVLRFFWVSFTFWNLKWYFFHRSIYVSWNTSNCLRRSSLRPAYWSFYRSICMGIWYGVNWISAARPFPIYIQRMVFFSLQKFIMCNSKTKKKKRIKSKKIIKKSKKYEFF